MQKAKLLKCVQPLPAPERKSDKVIAKAQCVEAGGEERILSVDLFYKGKLEGRYFNDGESFWAYVDGEWSSCKLLNAARKCKGLPALNAAEQCITLPVWEWESQKDKMVCFDCFGLVDLEELEYQIGEDQRSKAEKRKGDRIQSEMDEVPEITAEMKQWVTDEVFPGHYLFVKRLKKGRAFCCTKCLKMGTTSKNPWKNGETTKCPFCGETVTVSTRKTSQEKKQPVVFIQRMKDGDKWVERQFRAVTIWDTLIGKETWMLEDTRAVVENYVQWGKVYYGQFKQATAEMQSYWTSNPLGKRFMNSLLYPGNIKEMQEVMGLKRSGIDILADKGIPFHVNKFIISYRSCRWMEYLIKAGLTNLAADITRDSWGTPTRMNGDGENLKDLLNLDGNRVARMKAGNIGLYGLEWLQYEQKQQKKGKKIKISDESLKYLDENKIATYWSKDVLKAVKSVNRMVNYLKKQGESPGRVLQTWGDYLDMAEKEGYNIGDDIVRMPKELKRRHDELVERINARRASERKEAEQNRRKRLNEKIAEQLQGLKGLFWENRKYMIIPAGTCEELEEEGRTLHHCVGSSERYMRKMAEGETWILFLRKKEDISKAYYTVEIDLKTNEILQFYSEFDRKPDGNIIRNVLDQYTKRLTKAKAA